MVRGIVFGCFDPLHAGHVRMLKECRLLCNELFVFVHSDSYIKEQKGRKPFFDESSRIEDVEGIKWADYVHFNRSTDRNYWIKEIEASVIFVAGDMDGKGFICESVRVPRTEGINSTMLRS